MRKWLWLERLAVHVALHDRIQLQYEWICAVFHLPRHVRRWIDYHRWLVHQLEQHDLHAVFLWAILERGRRELHNVSDNCRLQHELAADEPELVRVQRGLRLERDAAGLRRAHALHARRDLLCVGLRALHGLLCWLRRWPVPDRELLGDGQCHVRVVRAGLVVVGGRRQCVHVVLAVPGGLEPHGGVQQDQRHRLLAVPAQHLHRDCQRDHEVLHMPDGRGLLAGLTVWADQLHV